MTPFPPPPALPKPDESIFEKIMGVAGSFYVPHCLMEKGNLQLILNAGTLFVVGGSILTFGRYFVATGQSEMATNAAMTVICYMIMFVAGVIGICVSPNATLKDDTAKLTTLVYFLFLSTILFYAIATALVFFATGDTPVNLMREWLPPWMTRFVISGVGAALTIVIYVRRSLRFRRDDWNIATRKATWIAIYWMLTSSCAAWVLSTQ